MTLTGKVRHRAGWLGGLVLQVEVMTIDMLGLEPVPRKFYRDASVADLTELNAMVYSKIDVYLPEVPGFTEEDRRGSRNLN